MRRANVISLVAILGVAFVALVATIATGNKPLLGLDLQGGASVVLKPEGTTTNGILDQAISIIRKRVDALGVAEPNISRQGSNVVIELPGIKDPQSALQTVGQTAELRFRPVLCNAAPFTKPTTSSTTAPAASTTTPAASTTVPASGKGLGVPGGGPGASLEAYRQLPAAGPPPAAQTATTAAGSGATSSTAAPAATATTAPGSATATTAAGATTTTVPPVLVAPTDPSKYDANLCAELGADGGASLPTTPNNIDNGQGYALLPQVDQKTGRVLQRFVLGPTELTGSVVSSAASVPPTLGGDWSVQVTFTNSGGPAFDKLAAKYVNKQVAIVLDGVVESAPTIQTTSFNGTASITGSFTQSQADALSLQLRYGSLPVQFQPQSIQAVSASLGKDSLRAGLLAGAIGLILVLAYMILYYRALGIVVILGLSVSGALLYSIISALSQSSGLALSLAGATGIIVSVGVTADSYIVYFERLKDEIRSGKSVRLSVDKTFSRAYRTILAADSVSFLAALILYVFTVGSVRGFAFFLGLSTLLDVFTAYFFTRPVVALLARNKLFTEARFFGVARGLAAPKTPGGAP